jgi:hypothetical protein
MDFSEFRYGGRSGFVDALRSFIPFASIIVVVLIIAIVVVLIIAVVSKGKRGRSPNLILEEFSLNEIEDEFLKIKGRASGFWNWVLSLFDKAPITRFTCNRQVLKYEEGNIKYTIPLVNITCVSSGMTKSSILLLVLGIICLISIIAIPIGIILLIVYALNKKIIHFGIYIGENTPMVTITMKRGIIGSIDKDKFELAASALNEAVLC